MKISVVVAGGAVDDDGDCDGGGEDWIRRVVGYWRERAGRRPRV